MTHRNADPEVNPWRIAPGEIFMVPKDWTMEEARSWLDANDPTKHKSADQRIREAFDALRAEIEAVFGEPPELPPIEEAFHDYRMALHHVDAAQGKLHDFAKLPADA